MIVSKKFLEQPTIKLAKELLGTYLVHESKQGLTVGRIVETEAYLDRVDPASHSYNGKTKRNAAMFGPAGSSYIYFIYGSHYCFNVVSGEKGRGEAILLRALEPIKGLSLMKKRRGQFDIFNLCSGPAKLVQAMGINKNFNTHFLRKKPLYILKRTTSSNKLERISVQTTKRIGISKGNDMMLRFYIKGSKYISRK